MGLFRFLEKERSCLFLADPQSRVARKFEHFKRLLAGNNASLDLIPGWMNAIMAGPSSPRPRRAASASGSWRRRKTWWPAWRPCLRHRPRGCQRSSMASGAASEKPWRPRQPEMADGRASVQVRPVGGTIDQAGGLAFGLVNAGNSYVFRCNALEDNVMLFAFRDGRRSELASAPARLETGVWRKLAVETRGREAKCLLDGRPVIAHRLDAPVSGRLGLWAKADSITDFSGLGVEKEGARHVVDI